MTALLLTLERVSHRLADGRVLFSDLSFQFEPIATGLVGANGVGKTHLARLLAGHDTPQQGRCLRGGRVFLLPARSGAPRGSIGALAGVGAQLRALDRIVAGSVDAEDFTLAEGHWDLRERLARQWQECGLPAGLSADDDAASLSGGQAMQVALSGAWASAADWLILDEPSNHLDRQQRALLVQQLQRWRGGLLVISHDRALLEHMHCIVELDGQGLHRHGGPYAHYASLRRQQQQAAQARADHARNAHRQQQRQARQQHERAQQRQARGNHDARHANQAPILLGLQKQRAQASAGRVQQASAARLQESSARVREAAAAAPQAVVLAALAPAVAAGSSRIARLQSVVLPFGNRAPLDLIVQRGQRIALVGSNGSGKSTLMKVMAGQLAAEAGTIDMTAHVALLDQDLAVPNAEQSVLQVVQVANPEAPPAQLRTRLALLGLDADRIARPFATLSAGERLKGALACALYATPAPELLLLDEPGNGLDLDALEALQHLLAHYRGTVVMSSHDPHLLQALCPTHQLCADGPGWHLQHADGAAAAPG